MIWNKRYLRFACSLPLTFCGGSLFAGELLAIKLDAGQSALTATFFLSDATDINNFSLTEPHRYVVDFASTDLAANYRTPDVIDDSLLLSVREGMQADGRLRLVFDLKESVRASMQATPDSTDEGYSITLTMGSTRPVDKPADSDNVDVVQGSTATTKARTAWIEQGGVSNVEENPANAEANDSDVDSFVFGDSRSSAAESAPATPVQTGGWHPQLTRGLVEGGTLIDDESRPGYNLHVQAVGTLTKRLNDNIEVRLGARFDAHVQGGDINSYDLAELDYDETWIRYRTDDFRLTVGAQRIIWGRADEISPTDRLSTRDLTRFILDDLPNRRRANPAVRMEFLRDDWTFDFVYLPVFREAELPGAESIWSPIGSGQQGIAGLPLDPGDTGIFDNVSLENDASGDGGGGLRISHFGDNVDYALTLQRVNNPDPYLSLAEPTTPGVTNLETVYPRTWVAGGDFGVAVADWTFRFEGAWLSDTPYTDKDFVLQSSEAINWVLGADVSPGDGDARLTLQLVGMHLLDADQAIDRQDTLGITGAISSPLPDRRFSARLRWWAGLNRRDDYINTEIVFNGWEPSQIYLGVNLFYGDSGTLGDFYNRNNMIVLGWRGRF